MRRTPPVKESEILVTPHPPLQSGHPSKPFGRHRRKKLGLSKVPPGYQADAHRTHVSDVEGGARNRTARVSWKLADALEVEPSRPLQIAEEVVAGRVYTCGIGRLQGHTPDAPVTGRLCPTH